MIKANKTFTLDVPLITKNLPERRLVRTGSYADGNCFIHALLRAIDIGYRRQTSYSLHLKLVERFRKDIAEWITMELFQQLGNGVQIRIAFLTEFNVLIEKMFEEKDQHPSPVIRVLYQVLPKDEVENNIIPRASDDKNFYVSFCNQLEERLRVILSKVEPSKVDLICTQMHEHCIHLFQEAHKKSLENFKAKFLKMGEYVDSLQMECLSKYTGYNFIFIQNNEVYTGNSNMVSFDKSRKTLIFLWINENHFEIIGELEEHNMINRIFESDDELVRWLNDPNNQSSPDSSQALVVAE